MEEMNKPVVVLINESFSNVAQSAASGRQMPGIRYIAESVPTGRNVPEQVETGLGPSIIDKIVSALIKPLTLEEQSPKGILEKTSRIAFKGNFQEINQFFYKMGWTDGLPIVPPTEETVAEMLTGTDLPREYLVGKIEPRLGNATVEKIAINAVMAGALPTYLPIIIAGVQAVIEKSTRFTSLGVSTGSWIPFWIINGPIRTDVNVNGGQGAMNPGNIANATIGRALGLIIKNIGGIRKGMEDMGSIGNPGKYSMVLAENEEGSPWDPFHVDKGFNKDDSTITLNFPNSYWQVETYGTNAKSILKTIIYNLHPEFAHSLTVILIPAHAKIMAESGWTKKEIAEFITTYARTPLNHLPQYHGALMGLPGRKYRQLNMEPDDPVPIIDNPDMIRVIVAGGAGGFMALAQGAETWETKKIELPANWNKLVAKYKGLVPKYVMY
jgi:hypothetical protein